MGQSIQERLTSIVLPILFAVFVSAGLLIMALVYFGFVSVKNPIVLADMLLSGILTASTVYLLYNQTQLSDRQTEIEEKTLKYETEPAIQIVSKQIDGNDVFVDIANYGRGVAENLKLVVNPSCEDIDWFSGVPAEVPLQRYKNNQSTEDDSVRPQNEPQTYVAESVTFGRDTNDASEKTAESPPETILQRLKEDSDGRVVISLKVTGNSIISEAEPVEEEIDEDIEVMLSDLPSEPRLSEVEQYQVH